jgi:hypothetical protein
MPQSAGIAAAPRRRMLERDAREDPIMWLTAGPLATLAVAAGAASGVALPVATAQPYAAQTDGSAAAVIDDLESQGYNVTINWLTGYDTKPLNRCWVTNINNPGNLQPGPDTFVTVYVDVRCPNNEEDGGFTGGISVGVG